MECVKTLPNGGKNEKKNCNFIISMYGNRAKRMWKTEPIRIASKPMTEQYILTEMIGQLIEAETDYEVEITKGVGGGTTNIHPALVKGEFDLYPEYTRTAWLNVLKKEEMEKDDDKLYGQLQEEYDALGLTWTGLYGFSNTYGLAVRQKPLRSTGLPLILIWRLLPAN